MNIKKVILSLFLSATSLIGLAQNGGYEKGDKLLNVGLGINSSYSGGIPIGASYELGLTDAISVGVNADYLSHNYNYGSGFKYKFTALYFAARASYHVNELLKIENEKIDLYGGATLGYRSFKWNDSFSSGILGDSYGSGLYLGAYAGGKYYFSEKVSIFTELGAIGSTNARLGVGFKF